jgi:hypothetical protein
VATPELAKPEASSASAKASAAPGPTSASNWAWASLDRVELGQAARVEQRCGDDQHRHVDQAGDAHRDRHVQALEAQQLAPLAVVARADAVLGERRVQVDDVRHDRRAEDAGGQQHAVGVLEGGDEAGDRLAGVEADAQRVVEEAEQDHAEHAGDRQLEAAVPAALQRQDPEGDGRRDQAGREQRDAEQQVQGDRRAHELGEVGRHRDQLGLHPQPEADRPREALATQLGQVATGRDAHLGRQVLDEHRHQVGREQDPQQQVAVLGAARDVRREVARGDVGDVGDEGRAQQGERATEPAAAADAPQIADGSAPHGATFAAGWPSAAPPPPATQRSRRAAR